MSDEIIGYPDHYHVNGDTSACFNKACRRDATAREGLERTAFNDGPEYATWFLGTLNAFRAEVLREAADTAQELGTELYEDSGQRQANGAWRVAAKLRRMADEEPQ